MSAGFPKGNGQSLLTSYNPNLAQIRNVFREIRQLEAKLKDDETKMQGGKSAQTGKVPAKSISVDISTVILANGLSVGEFCCWFIAKDKTMSDGGKRRTSRQSTAP